MIELRLKIKSHVLIIVLFQLLQIEFDSKLEIIFTKDVV